MRKLISLPLLLVLLVACATTVAQPEQVPVAMDTPQANMPNPASVYCEQQGYRLEIQTSTDGSQYGMCVFPDGSTCEEWAYYRGECAPPDPFTPPAEVNYSDWKTYHDERMHFSFQYPADATIEVDGYSVFVNGPIVENNVWPVFMISFPNDQPEYQVPADVDLQQWLVDHNLNIDQPQPDAIIAGTTAVHTRFPGGQQSYADDRYYFVHEQQMYVIAILHSGNREDWELYEHFLDSFQFETTTTGFSPATLPTAIPIDPSLYQGWWTYAHPDYGFSIQLPEDWVVDEFTSADPLMSGHSLNLHPKETMTGQMGDKENIRLTFRRIGEETRLWPTGVGQGEFIPQGTLVVAGQPAQRFLLVCPTGEITAIWYHQTEGQPNISRGDLEFGFIFSAAEHCEASHSLSGKTQLVGEMIIASLSLLE